MLCVSNYNHSSQDYFSVLGMVYMEKPIWHATVDSPMFNCTLPFSQIETVHGRIHFIAPPKHPHTFPLVEMCILTSFCRKIL